MTPERVRELANDSLFSIGAHTVDHPFLRKCTTPESRRQIVDNKMWLEEVSRRTCNIIAYPGGDYNMNVLQQCQSLGFVRGYSVIPNTDDHSQLELPRIGIYSPSLDVLGFKVQWGNTDKDITIKNWLIVAPVQLSGENLGKEDTIRGNTYAGACYN